MIICLLPQEIEYILSKKYFSADEFTKSVLMAEGMNPEMELKHFRSIKNKFTDKFGSEVTESDY